MPACVPIRHPHGLPLSAAAQLKRTLENRDKRRQADKIARHAGQDDENDAVQQQPTRASVPNQSVAALTALSGQQSQQPVLRCELCQVGSASVLSIYLSVYLYKAIVM